MAVVRWNGTSTNQIKFSSLSATLRNAYQAASTILVVVKHASVPTAWQAMFSAGIDTGAVADTLEFAHDANNQLTVSETSTSFTPAATSGVQDTTNAYLYAVTKATGTGTPTLVRRNVTSLAVHNSLAMTGAASAYVMPSGGVLRMGAWRDAAGTLGDNLNAWLGILAIFNVSMTATQIAALVNNRKTSDIYNAAPVFLAEFNTLTPVDLIGNAAFLSAGGVSLDAAETLGGWNFDGAGITPPNDAHGGLVPAGMFDSELNSQAWF